MTSTSNAIRLNPFTVPGRAARSCYFSYYNWDSTGFGGKQLLGSMTSNNKIDFYVMTPQQFSSFQEGGGTSCSDNPSNGLVAAGETTSYSLDWSVPVSEGTYYFVFYNDGSLEANVNFAAWTKSQASVTLQGTATSVWTETSTLAPTGTQTSSTQAQTSQTQAPIAGGELLYLAIIAVVVVLAIIALVALRRKGAKPVAPKTTRAAERIFCMNCGAELKPASKFCSKCGSTQP